jgi:flagellar basal body-associated protein FliL
MYKVCYYRFEKAQGISSVSKKNSDPKKVHNRKKVILIIAIGVIALIGVGTGSYFAYKHFFPYGQISIDSDLPSKVNNITNKEGYDAGQKYLDSALDQAKTDQERAEVYANKANLIFSRSDSDNTNVQKAKDALDYAREAQKLNPTQTNTLSLASLEKRWQYTKCNIVLTMYVDKGSSSAEHVVVMVKKFYSII